MPKQATTEGLLQNEAMTTIEAPKYAVERSKQFDVTRLVLATGEQYTLWSDRIPDWWYIIAPLENSGLVAWLWPGASLPAEKLPLYGGGHTQIPGRSQYITIGNEAGAELDLRVIAISGFDIRDVTV